MHILIIRLKFFGTKCGLDVFSVIIRQITLLLLHYYLLVNN